MKRTSGLVVAGLLLVAMFTSVSEARTIKIAYVDIGRLVDDSERVKRVIEPLKQQYENDSRNITTQQKTLQERIKELEKRAETSGEDTEIVRQRERLLLDLAKFTEEARTKAREFEKKQAENLKPLILAVEDKMEEIGKERGLDFIFRKQDVPYVNSKYDITDEVIKRIDASVSAVSGGGTN